MKEPYAKRRSARPGEDMLKRRARELQTRKSRFRVACSSLLEFRGTTLGSLFDQGYCYFSRLEVAVMSAHEAAELVFLVATSYQA